MTGDAWYSKSTNYPLFFYLIVFVLIFAGLLHLSQTVAGYSSEEARLLGSGVRLKQAIEKHYSETGNFPVNLGDVVKFMPADRDWPDNPWSGLPMVDTKTSAFDPVTSPGNVYYERVMVGEDLQGYDRILNETGQAGYVLHLFNDEGLLKSLKGSRNNTVEAATP